MNLFSVKKNADNRETKPEVENPQMTRKRRENNETGRLHCKHF